MTEPNVSAPDSTTATTTRDLLPSGGSAEETPSLEAQLDLLVSASDKLLTMLGRQTTQVLVFVAFLLCLACAAFPGVAVVWNADLSDPEYVSTTIVGGFLALVSVCLLVRESTRVSVTLAEQRRQTLKAQAELDLAREIQLRGQSKPTATPSAGGSP